MKKLICVLLFFTTLSNSQAQNVKYGGWNQQIVVGANASINSTWIFNSAVQSLDDGVSDQVFSFGYAAGGSFEYRFNELIALGLDLQYFSAQQKYDGTLQTQGKSWESSVRLNGLNLPVYAKIMGKTGIFLEVGWQFGFILGARYNRFSAIDGTLDDNIDVSESFGTVVLSPHLGFGFDFFVTDELMVTFGIRGNYGINDIKGVDGVGNPIDGYPNTLPGNQPLSPADVEPSPSRLFSAGLFLGVRYAFDAGGRY